MSEIKIESGEFQTRWKRTQEAVRAKGLDVLIVHSNEADFANVRYLSDYWPIFECAGVIIPAHGEPALCIGPESETYASDRSAIKKIYKLVEYRESAEPEYPGIKVDTFKSIFAEMFAGKAVSKIGLAGYQIFPLPVYEAIRAAAPNAQIVKSDEIIFSQRVIKSNAELKILRRAFEISERALETALREMKPEMTELQTVGIIQKEMYAQGAEYEGHPTYVLSGRNSNHAIGRPTHQVLGKGNLIQLNIGARVSGYSSSVGRPVCFGKMPADMRRLVQAGLELHFKTMEWTKAGVIAKDITEKFFKHAEKLGVRENALYGPCHGLGMMEVEQPWMESHSNYQLKENMTFQVDTFLYNPQFGLRWENGVVVTADGVKPLSGIRNEILEL
jgi:Xaa-Pro aminopeptidase